MNRTIGQIYHEITSHDLSPEEYRWAENGYDVQTMRIAKMIKELEDKLAAKDQ